MSVYSGSDQSPSVEIKQMTAPEFRERKGKVPLSVLTAYDYPTARILDEAGVDALLVGDSLGPVVYGYPNTLPVTLDDMIRHTRAVARGAKRALVILDLPFMSYQVSPAQALESAGRALKESFAQAVKLEGGSEVAEQVRALTQAGIPVMAHIGLTPQSIHQMGKYRIHGKGRTEADVLRASALELQQAGAFSMVLECVEAGLAKEITRSLDIPTIGIGSGKHCDGQVLVIHDLVGLTMGHVPRFVEPLANFREEMTRAVECYIQRTRSTGDVQGPGLSVSGKSPAQENLAANARARAETRE